MSLGGSYLGHETDIRPSWTRGTGGHSLYTTDWVQDQILDVSQQIPPGQGTAQDSVGRRGKHEPRLNFPAGEEGVQRFTLLV